MNSIVRGVTNIKKRISEKRYVIFDSSSGYNFLFRFSLYAHVRSAYGVSGFFRRVWEYQGSQWVVLLTL